MFEENDIIKIGIDDITSIPIQSKLDKPNKSKHKIEICKVLWSKQNSFAISFKGFGITIPTEHKIYEKEIKIKYLGTIGESDFEILKS